MMLNDCFFGLGEKGGRLCTELLDFKHISLLFLSLSLSYPAAFSDSLVQIL